MLAFRIGGFVILGLVCLNGCEKKTAVCCVADAFSGETVADGNQAADIILARSKNAPVTGEAALNGTVYEPLTQDKIELESLWKSRPTALIFGSGSCTSSNLFNEDLNRLAKQYEERVDFNFIYIREAHPEGGFQPMLQSDFAKETIPSIKDATDLRGRCEAGLAFRERKDFNFRFLVDDIDDPVAASWGAWPTRIFVINTDGKVLYSGGQGPWYFSVTKESWHDPPPPFLDVEFQKRPFDQISLEEFLERQFGANS